MNTIKWFLKSIKHIKKLDKPVQQPIYDAVDRLSAMPDCQNVKALVSHRAGYRLRVGNYRVLFDWYNETRIVAIEEVKKRDDRTY